NSIYVVALTVDLQPTRPDAPVADFVANVTSGELPLAVAFTDQSTNSPTSWSWDFGDGATSGERDPVHTYTSAGTYTVNLTASSGSGTSSAQAGIVVTKPDPILFNTSVTVYMDEPIVVDGVRYSGNTFFNILAAAGYTYTYADNDSGYSDRKPLLTLTMDGVTYPTKDFGEDYAWKFYETIGTGGDVKFKKALNGYISESGTYYIWYGDLSQFNWWDLPSFENSTYVVKLNVELLPTRPSGDGAPSGVTITSPLSNSSYAVGASVHLAATATGDNLTYTWDLGNGDTVTGKTADYTYTTAGNYTIALTVANDAGSAEASTGITILDSDLPYIVLYQDTVDIVDGSTIMAAISPRSGGYTAGEDYIEIPANSVGGMLNASGFIFDMWKSQKPIPTYSLMDITTSDGVCYPNVQNATADLAWRSFDGMTAAATKYDPNVALENGTIIYTVYGDYSVINSDPSGAQYVIITTLNIVDSEPADEPVADFTANVTSGDAPLAVAFTDLSTNTPTSWAWTFGDGASSAEQDPVHTYTAPGTYTVNLTAANAAGSDSATQTITVTEAAEGETDTIVLQPGWNFVSTPKRLAAGADTYAIFNGVDTASHTILLYDGLDYDWEMMGPTDTFQPLDAVWIYANGTYEIPLAFASGSPDLPPTKDLGKGWNAIGFSGTEPQSAATSLLSLSNHWATLIGYDAVDQRYEAGIIRTSESEARRMQPTQGYWIYMTQPDTLAAISG
ncbi:MAG: PKD domain-containing protein, partial [Methanoculleus sp.]|nr:PKD domain-containing protein [Methanoculleus sp.]